MEPLKTFPKIIYYYVDSYNDRKITEVLNIISFKVDETNVNACFTTDEGSDEEIIAFATFNNDHQCWMVHCENGPAVFHKEDVYFYHNGIKYDVEDYPCDEETRCFLRLKYG